MHENEIEKVSTLSEMMVSILSEISGQYTDTQIMRLLTAIQEDSSLRIAFIGEFGSGKSTLLNALIGDNFLPIGAVATTRAITELVSSADVEEPTFFRTNLDGSEETISRKQFEDDVQGEELTRKRVLIPPTEWLPQSFSVLDTPGFSSLENEAKNLFQILSEVDGIVLCMDITKGGVSASIMDLLSYENIDILLGHCFVALTKAECVTPSEIAHIAEKVGGDLFSDTQSQTRVFPVSAIGSLEGDSSDSDAVDAIRKAFGEHFVAPKRTLCDSKYERDLRNLCKQTLDWLEDFRTQREWSSEKLDKEIQVAEREKENLSKRLTAFRIDLRRSALDYHSSAQELAQNYAKKLGGASKSDTPKLLVGFSEELQTLGVDHAQKVSDALKGIGLSSSADLEELSSNLQRLTSKKEVFVRLGTGIAVALLVPDFTGGAAGPLIDLPGKFDIPDVIQYFIGQKLAKQSAKEGEDVSEILRKKSMKTAKKLTKKIDRTFSLKDFNPIEILGKFFLKKFQAEKAEESLIAVVANSQNVFFKVVGSAYEEQFFSPLKRKIESQITALSRARKARELELGEFQDETLSLNNLIRKLGKLID